MKAAELKALPIEGVPAGAPRPTCRACGKPLKMRVDYVWPLKTSKPTARKFAGWGDRGDGLFCGLRCGYTYGVQAAEKKAVR